MNRSAALALALALALLAAACGASPTPAPSSIAATAPGAAGSAAASPTPVGASAAPASAPHVPATSPSATPATTPRPSAVPAPPAVPFRLASSAFAAGGSIPSTYTCDGAGVSPALSWTGVPAGTKALVLLVTDPDASGFAHWIVIDIGAGAQGLARGAGAAAASLHQGTNDFGHVGWGGPCPPSGTHRYQFTLYAVANPLGLAGHPRIGAVQAALGGVKVLASTTLQATYKRP